MNPNDESNGTKRPNGTYEAVPTVLLDTTEFDFSESSRPEGKVKPSLGVVGPDQLLEPTEVTPPPPDQQA